MFWALVIVPNKRYTQVVSKSFHVSMACLDLESADGEATSVLVEVNEDKLILCNLAKNKCVQQALDLNFQTGDEISFFTKGKATVHLTGYLIPEDDVPELMSDQESDEEEEEDDVAVLTQAKEKMKALTSKAMKRSMEEKASKNKKQKLDISVGEEDSDEDDEDFELEEDSEGVSGEEEAGSDSEGESDEDMEESMEEKKDTGKKGKQKEIKGKPMKKESLPAKKEALNGTPNQLSAKKKKQKDGATPQAKDGAKTPNKEEMVKKTLQGGVAIEDLKIGNGPVAKAGRMVAVYYTGRLKQNNKTFDSTLQGPGFKFRLGSNEVLKGWDLGLVGMKVGGKRKVVCPPNMAYGSKGSPPVIPPNSTLVFEVELKSVH